MKRASTARPTRSMVSKEGVPCVSASWRGVSLGFGAAPSACLAAGSGPLLRRHRLNQREFHVRSMRSNETVRSASVLDPRQRRGLALAFGFSRITSSAFLSVRRPEKHRVAHLALRRPFGELHLADELRLHPGGVAASGTFSATGFVVVISGTSASRRAISASRD